MYDRSYISARVPIRKLALRTALGLGGAHHSPAEVLDTPELASLRSARTPRQSRVQEPHQRATAPGPPSAGSTAAAPAAAKSISHQLAAVPQRNVAENSRGAAGPHLSQTGSQHGLPGTRPAAAAVPGISPAVEPSPPGSQMRTSNRSVSHPCSKRVSATSRTAVYGPVRTVVWEGRSCEAPPYPDQSAFILTILHGLLSDVRSGKMHSSGCAKYMENSRRENKCGATLRDWF